MKDATETYPLSLLMETFPKARITPIRNRHSHYTRERVYGTERHWHYHT